MFDNLKQKVGKWGDIAKLLKINPRNLFGIRRGWEYRKGIKLRYRTSAKWLSLIKSKSNLNLHELEKNIIDVRLGRSGKISKIKFPLTININKEPIYTVNRALVEHVYIKRYKKTINLEYLPHFFKKDKGYIILNVTNKNKLKVVPKKVVFNESFAKEFGKWLGDRCGGPRRVGASNKEITFIEDFKEFLRNTLKQKEVKIILRCKEGFTPSEEIIEKAEKLEYSRSQYGDYAYVVGVPNKELNQLVFKVIEENIFKILYSSPKKVRYAFFAGLIEAEGSIEEKSKLISISFGFNLNKKRDNKDYLTLLKKVINFRYILEKDGFHPRISRKVGNTEKSFTLKYDITLLNNHKTRPQEVRFIKDTIVPFLRYKAKLKKFAQMEKDLLKEKEPTQPEVNIGLIGQ